MISGGYTRGEVERSEARGYFEAGVAVGGWGWGDLMGEGEGAGAGRIILEEGALDSFGNLVRGLLAFWRGAGGVWPGRVEVVSHGFKGGRFLGLHCRALRLGGCGEGREGREKEEGEEGRKGVEVVFRGIDPRFMDEESEEFDAAKCEETRRGEREFGYGEWAGDLWGVGEKLRRKRDRRDAWGGRRGKGDGDGDAGRVTREEGYQGRALFESEEERVRSGVRTRWLEAENGMTREEVIVEGVEMPWELGTIG